MFMISSRDFTCSSCSMVTVVVTGHSSRRSTPPRWTPTGNGLQRGQFCWPPLGKTVDRQRAATWPPLGRISWPPTGGIRLVSFQIPAMALVDGLCDFGEEPPRLVARVWGRRLHGVVLSSLNGSGGILVGRCVHRRLVLNDAAASRELRAPPELAAGVRSSPGGAPNHRPVALRAVGNRHCGLLCQ